VAASDRRVCPELVDERQKCLTRALAVKAEAWARSRREISSLERGQPKSETERLAIGTAEPR
jgi:hypothetical protein